MVKAIAAILIAALTLSIGGSYLVSMQAPTISADECLAADLNQIHNVIEEQTRAMTNQDFQSARSYASQSFQATVPVALFASIISNEYPFLMQDPIITFNGCQLQGSLNYLVSASFEVDGASYRLDYAMVKEESGWSINSASTSTSQQIEV